MGRYTQQQRTMNINSTLELLSVSEKGVLDRDIKETNRRLSQIDMERAVLNAEERDLYLKKAKLLEEKARIKRINAENNSKK